MNRVEAYQPWADHFNALPFKGKIEFLQGNLNLTLKSDGNWWKVEHKDPLIQEELDEAGVTFKIEREWGSSEMCDLIELLNVSNTDY